AAHSSAATMPSVAARRFAQARTVARRSVIAASLLVELPAEPAQEARQADQHEGAGGDEEPGLEIAAEGEPLERLGVAVVVGEIAELREQQREVPAGEEQE